jgi:hypothetical protein
LVTLIGESNEAISTGHSRNRISHDLGRLARRESGLEKRHENVFIDLRAKIANEDREFRATLITTVIVSKNFAASMEGLRYMNRESDRRSARPPPEAQFSLKGRLVLGIMEPFNESAFAAAAGEAKSMKQ